MTFESLADLQTVIMTGDAGVSLSWEYEYHPERLIGFYRDSIATGKAISESALKNAKQLADDARKREASIFEKVDILLTLPASGEAPEGIDFTGDPLFNRVWTLLGWPCQRGGRARLCGAPCGVPGSGQLRQASRKE